jgi:hypothetical protein
MVETSKGAGFSAGGLAIFGALAAAIFLGVVYPV